MYARSYEKSTYEEEPIRTLPSGYSGVAFESEAAEPPPPPDDIALRGEECVPAAQEATEVGSFASLLTRIPFLQRIKLPFGEKFSIGGWFSDTEDLLLIGLALLLLFSKEADPLCAVAVLILFFLGKD